MKNTSNKLRAVALPGLGMRPQRTAYTQRKDNEGFEVPNGEIYKLACCDCGLVHQIVIVAPGLKKGTPLGMAAKRDNRATAARRRRAHTTNYPEHLSGDHPQNQKP